MNLVRLGAVLAGLFMLIGQALAADDSAPLIGTWIDKLPNGYAMVTAFTADSMKFYPVDPSGEQAETTSVSVTYKKQKDGSIQVNPGEKVGAPLVVNIKDANTLVLAFEGMEPRTLTRQKTDAKK